MHTFDLNPTSLSKAIRHLQDCIIEIREWLTANYLKVNDQKTEFLLIMPVSVKKLINELSISVGGTLIQDVDQVKNDGVYLDNHMNMSANTSEIVQCCYFHIHHIGQINKFLPRQMRERVNTLVTQGLTIVILCYMAQLTRTLPDYSVFKIQPLDWSSVWLNILTSVLKGLN